MTLKLYTFLFILASSLLLSCKTAEKLYARGQYDEAVGLATKKLAKKPNDAALRELVQNAYRYAVEDHESRIQNLSNSNSGLRYEKIYSEYTDLQRLYTAIRRSPAVFELVQPTDYSSYIATYKEEAGNARYERGMELMSYQSRQGYRDAYYEFQKALTLKPGDISIRQKMDEAYANAVTNVVIMPLTRYGYQYSSYSFDYNNFNYNLLRYLGNNRASFFDYYSSADAASRNIRPDYIVNMRFSDVNIGRYRDQQSTREVSRQIVARETVYKPDSVTREYITVRARITTTTRTLLADGLLQATVSDIDNRRLWSDAYRGEYNWVTRFASFTGDERALSDDDKALISRREERPPSDDEIIRIIMSEILTKTQCGLNDYFNRVR